MSKNILVSHDTLKKVISEWWDRWHRFAEEDDVPPQYIQEIIDTISEYTGNTFDTMSGGWH